MAHRRTLAALAALGATAALALAGVAPASADPDNTKPGTSPTDSSGTPLPANKIYATVGADAFAELTNNWASVYNAQTPAPARVIASYDAINPSTGAAGETITTKPGCPVARPNGANAGISAITLNQQTADKSEYCIDFVRSSRAKNTTVSAENDLTFYAQSRDAVSYAVVGNAYAPTTPLTTAQLKGIFECTITDWSQVGGQAGAIHVYTPPTTAATYTFFLQAIGSSLASVTSNCKGITTYAGQQNDGGSLNGDPQGILPYAVTKWAAQSNGLAAISDLRGGAHIGLVNTAADPFTTMSVGAKSYRVLSPDFAKGASASFGRLFYNTVRNTAPQSLKDLFTTSGYLCQHADEFLIPFGNAPLGNDSTANVFCGQES